jgi:serine/threonine protein kinase
MPGRVTLLVTAGPIQGRRFEFTEHDTFLFGRSPDCHAQLSARDTSASRHHFLLEVNPPAARLRDLGSLNGTHVNGTRRGGRARRETPEQAALREQPEVDLRDGDRIRVGATILTLAVEAPSTGPPPPRSGPPVEGRTGGVVGDYEVGPLLGKGGMGAVYRARRRSDGRDVALKLLLPRIGAGPEARAHLLREAEVMRRLRHPNIVELLDSGEDGEGFFWAMEYCPRGSILARIRLEGALPLEVAGPLALQALEGLAFAHAAGFVHRDIKPDNVLLGPDGVAKLTDFGLAKSFEQAGLSGMTATGASAGTLSFMPREQITSFRQLRPVSDVWSMGATVYYMLTRQYTRDFAAGKDPLAVVLSGRIVPLRRRAPHLPAAVAAVVDRAIADDPERRYPTAAELRDALREAVG